MDPYRRYDFNKSATLHTYVDMTDRAHTLRFLLRSVGATARPRQAFSPPFAFSLCTINIIDAGESLNYVTAVVQPGIRTASSTRYSFKSHSLAHTLTNCVASLMASCAALEGYICMYVVSPIHLQIAKSQTTGWPALVAEGVTNTHPDGS